MGTGEFRTFQSKSSGGLRLLDDMGAAGVVACMRDAMREAHGRGTQGSREQALMEFNAVACSVMC